MEWEEFIKKNNLNHTPNQKKFYERVKNFLNDDKDVLINQGGMGLGKTKATVMAMKNNDNYIATPFSQLKNEWSNELNKCGKSHGVWLSKTDCCIKKRENEKFKIENCDDGCQFRSHLEENKEYSPLCSLLSDNLKFPIITENYYKEHRCKNCLLPLTRHRIHQENIVVGDYLGFLVPSMFRFVTKKEPAYTDLHIDEAHMIIERAKQFLSKELSLGRSISKMKKEIEEDNGNYFLLHPNIKLLFEDNLKYLEKVKQFLIDQIKTKKEKIDRITYDNFCRIWIEKNNSLLSSYLYYIDEYTKYTKSEDIETPRIFQQFYDFFNYWSKKSHDADYNGLFQYFSYGNEDIILKVNCNNTSTYLGDVLSIWRKVHLLSGTIPDKEYYCDMLGLNRLNHYFEEPLDSYSLKGRVINYAIGNFKSKDRKITYAEQKSLLKDVLKKLQGRTLIYVQSKEEVQNLANLIQEFNPYLLDESNNHKLSIIKEQFNNNKKGIAIGYITGKVEGQNFLDEDNNAVENIIIYGYPYMQRGLEYNDYLQYWIKKLRGNQKRANEYVEFFPISSRIYQATMRAKRSKKDNPVIILWGVEFQPGCPGYNYSFSDLKGTVIKDSIALLKKIEELNEVNNGTNQ